MTRYEKRGKSPPIWIRLQRECNLTPDELWKAKKAELNPAYLFRVFNRGESVRKAVQDAFRKRHGAKMKDVEHLELSRKYLNRIIVADIGTADLRKHCTDKEIAKAFIDMRFKPFLAREGEDS